MAKQVYSGVTSPIAVASLSGPRISFNDVTAQPASNVLQVDNAWSLAPDDYVVVCITTRDVALNAVQSVQAPKQPTLIFNRAASQRLDPSTFTPAGEVEIWVAKATEKEAFFTTDSIKVNYTTGADITGVASVSVIRGAVNYDLYSIVGDQKTNATLTAQAVANKANTILFGYMAAIPTTAGGTSSLTFTGANVPVDTSAQLNKTKTGMVSVAIGISQPNYLEPLPSMTATLAASVACNVFTFLLVFNGPSVTLDDLTLSLTEDGPLLNDPTNVMPLYDITSITGLNDLAINSSVSEVDGVHGSYVNASYAKGKTVIINGTLYAAQPLDESLIDKLKEICEPQQNPIPLYYKLPNKTPRTLMCKPVGFSSNLDRGRSLGTVDFQVQVQSSDAYSTSDAAAVTVNTSPNRGNTYGERPITFTATITTGGNTDYYPTIAFRVFTEEVPVSPAQVNYFQFLAPAWAAKYFPGNLYGNYSGIIIMADTLVTGLYHLNMKDRLLTLLKEDGTTQNYSSAITGKSKKLPTAPSVGSGRDWFTLLKNQTQDIIMTRPYYSDHYQDGFTVYYASAWR